MISYLTKRLKYFILLTIVYIIFLSLFIYLQGLAFILLSFVFILFFLISTGVIIFIKGNARIEKNFREGRISLRRYNINKKIFPYLVIFLITLSGVTGFTCYSLIIPPIKVFLNQGHLNDLTQQLTKGKSTDHEKISALLEWFDPANNNIFDSWQLTHSKNPYWIYLDQYMIFTPVPPYICVRCYEDVDVEWLLTSHCGACGEYSRLFMIMADDLGFEVRRVYAPGEDHFWNEVMINNSWIPVDSTSVSIKDGRDGWKNYSFFETKEGNVSYVWAEYLHNSTIIDRTSAYTNLTNITLTCKDENNNSIEGLTITILSNNLHREDRIWNTYIEGQPSPITNQTGVCEFRIGGGTYNFIASNEKYYGESNWLSFSDTISSWTFNITIKKR